MDHAEVDPLEEASTVVREAADRGIPIRLVGGLAIRFLTPDFPPRARKGQDLDLASIASARAPLTEFLSERGYVPDKRFNNLHGHKQMYFTAPDGERGLDVMIDRLDMCHVLEFADRITRLPVTLDATDLLLSKLQIFELNEKDLQDALYLMAGLEVCEGDEPGSVCLDRFTDVLSQDWGWWRTVTGNLDRITSLPQDALRRLVPPDPPFDPVEQARVLRAAADDAPKGLKWKLRAKVGDRVTWYKLPEEVAH